LAIFSGSAVFEVAVEKSFNFLSEQYAELFAASRATAFQHPVWLDNLFGKLSPQVASEPLIIAVHSQDTGRLVMLLPLVRRKYGLLRVIEFADLRVSDYAAPVCSEDDFNLILRDDIAVRAIRKALAPFDFLRIKNLKQDRLPIERLLGVADATPMNMSAHAVQLQAPYAQWRAQSMNPSYQKELNKKGRQLRKKGELQFVHVQSPQEIRATLDTMRDYRKPRFEQRGEGEDDLLQKDAYFDFYLQIADAGKDALSRTYALKLDGRVIAGVVGLRHRDDFLVILGGFDMANFKNQSIGSLMFELIAEDCIARGASVLDFTIGDEPYKQLFGAHASPLYTVVSTGSALGSVGNFVMEQMPWMGQAAKRLLRRDVAA
jgi:CelD/BcsL family acetyltransferase involved in cellulose biosynthesis